ncbi:MAG: Smr/MutS family protein [Candidatus Korobacteraceae bacterium]
MPTPLLHNSAQVLEFDRLRKLLLGYCQSELGQARVEALAATGDRGWIERQQQLTSEVRQYLRGGGRFDFGGLSDPGKLLEKSRIQGAMLEVAELRDLLTLVDRVAEWREIVLHPPAALKGAWPGIEELSACIADFTPLLRFFRGKLLPDGTLDDRASASLGGIRREIERQRRLIQESLRGYLRRLGEGGVLQEELITIRGERFVIPVKSEHKRRVQGVVHGASSSGQTVFVEPLETIEQNNELVRLLEEEQTEIQRILREMTARIGEESHSIAASMETIAELELQFAKARFAEDYECVPVRFLAATADSASPSAWPLQAPPAQPGAALTPASQNQACWGPRAGPTSGDGGDDVFILRRARHPLLERTLRARGPRQTEMLRLPGPKSGKIVPISLELDRGHRQLVISGPNTGGKTVALKTIGLLALMAQSGIPVPAERAEFPIFDAVLADIGDYQSIEQNLSTFSAHVTNIDFISHTATPESLVLLDELGSATDPEEGAALAVAIADYFRRPAPASATTAHVGGPGLPPQQTKSASAGDPGRGPVCIVSTHHTSLKVYAENTEGVLNGAVGFDERTLAPTYELRVGVPGASAGINIAQRLGLNPQIIAEARERIGSQTQDVSRFLDRLHHDLRQLDAERAALAVREQELAAERRRLESEGLKEQREKVRQLERKLESLLRDFEYHAREAVNAVQDRAESMKLSREAERRIAKARREFREQFNQAVVAHATGADRGDPNAQPHRVQQVSEGDIVQLKSLGRSGKVTRKLADDAVEVQVGPMKMRIPLDDVAEVLARAASSPVQAARQKGISVRLRSEDEAAPSELKVIGYTVDDATRELEKFLDRAFLAGLARVRVVHGSGMGILRRALRQYLQNHPQVASISEPPQQEGGAGATVVELKV